MASMSADFICAVCFAGQSVRRWTGHGAGIQALALSPDGNMIITGSDDHTARIFSAA